MAYAPSDVLSAIYALLDELPASAAHREAAAFGESLKVTDGTVVLFGAGKLGRLCARGVSRSGGRLLAFCDRNADLHGQEVEGVPVVSPQHAARLYGETSLFVVTTWSGTGTETMAARIEFLRGLGCRHVIAFAPLAWSLGGGVAPFHAFDVPSLLLLHAADLRRLADGLADRTSQEVLLVNLKQRLRGEFSAVLPTPDQYFAADVLTLRQDEVLVDGGAYTGDTLDDFVRRSNSEFRGYLAFEPDPANAGRLAARVAQLPPELRLRVSVHPLALHSERALLTFSNNGSTTSQVDAAGTGSVRAERLDDVLGGTSITFLKLDVEGAELGAIMGAEATLRRCQPLVAVCVYHAPDDLWRLPEVLRRLLPDHALLLRTHGFDGWEMVLYAVPVDRLPPGAADSRSAAIMA